MNVFFFFFSLYHEYSFFVIDHTTTEPLGCILNMYSVSSCLQDIGVCVLVQWFLACSLICMFLCFTDSCFEYLMEMVILHTDFY